MVKMVKVRVAVGCPSGTTESWTDDTTVWVREDMVYYFTTNLLSYARRTREDDDWYANDWYDNKIYAALDGEPAENEFEIPVKSGIVSMEGDEE